MATERTEKRPRLETIHDTIFKGKFGKLIRPDRWLKIVKQKVRVFKPSDDESDSAAGLKSFFRECGAEGEKLEKLKRLADIAYTDSKNRKELTALIDQLRENEQDSKSD